MRLIDADKINFEEVFGGQSDFAKDIRESAQSLIDRQPTAFDKEKVMEKLEELSRNHFESADAIGNEEEYGESFAYKHAVEVVRKGGMVN